MTPSIDDRIRRRRLILAQGALATGAVVAVCLAAMSISSWIGADELLQPTVLAPQDVPAHLGAPEPRIEITSPRPGQKIKLDQQVEYTLTVTVPEGGRRPQFLNAEIRRKKDKDQIYDSGTPQPVGKPEGGVYQFTGRFRPLETSAKYRITAWGTELIVVETAESDKEPETRTTDFRADPVEIEAVP